MTTFHPNIISIYGEKGEAWIAGLPQLVAAISSKIDLRDLIEVTNLRRCVLTFLAKEIDNSYVLTNNLYEDAGDKVCYAEVMYMAEARGSIFVPVRLLIDQDEHLRRVVDPKRRDRWKSIDPEDVHDETPLLSISHPNLFSLNVSNLSPEDVAEAIMNHIRILSQR